MENKLEKHSSQISSADLELLYKKFDFSFEVMDLMMGGASIIDSKIGLTGFLLRSMEDADRFMASYGYDLEDPIQNAEVLGHFREAVDFIRNYFLKDELGDALEIPRKILEVTDIRDLLLMAGMGHPGQMNDPQGLHLRNWACAVLKVIHSIAHIDKDVRAVYFSDIQMQILDRFYKVIHREKDEGKLWLCNDLKDSIKIELNAFETKPKKSRESVLLKTLHKAESVSDEIFDQVGIRFVTPSPVEALQVIKFLKDSMVVMPANIKPSRSFNTLINLNSIKSDLDNLFRLAETGEISKEEFYTRMQDDLSNPENETDNPHSSKFYRSIHFTCRHLIKLKNPAYAHLKKLKDLAKKGQLREEAAALVEGIDLKYIQREIRFFYPYEVQVMDQDSYIENEKGRSSHTKYKQAQVQTAMKRVLGSLLDGIK